MGFTKLDSGLIYSSLLSEDDSVFKIFTLLLSGCKSDGICPFSSFFISTITKKTIDEVNRCLNILESPDKNSRSINDEGRRVKRVNGGFYVINYQKYREYTYSDSPEAKRQRKHREEKRDISLHVTNQCDISASASASASELELIKGTEDTKQDTVSKCEGMQGGCKRLQKLTPVNTKLTSASEKDCKGTNETEMPKNIPTPDFLKEAMEGFVENRKMLKRPLGDKARSLIIKKLEKLYPDNHEKQIECLNQSTENGWQGVFDIKTQQDQGRKFQNFGRQEVSMTELKAQAKKFMEDTSNDKR